MFLVLMCVYVSPSIRLRVVSYTHTLTMISSISCELWFESSQRNLHRIAVKVPWTCTHTVCSDTRVQNPNFAFLRRVKRFLCQRVYVITS